jgi:hypothetical protein
MCLTKFVCAAGRPSRPGSGSTGPIHQFSPSPAQQKKFVRELLLAVISACVPFSFFENEHLVNAANAVGIVLPSRKVVSTSLLDSVAAEVQLASAESLAAETFIDGSCDGWRKKYCEQGASMTNTCALTAHGSQFFDCTNCAGMRKDSPAIAEYLEGQAKGLTGGDLRRMAGFVLDNTKANWAAMKIVAAKHPYWIMRGCIAHGLSLCMKDFTSFKGGALVTAYKACNLQFKLVKPFH